MRNLLVVCWVLVLLFPAFAFGADGMYVGGNIGLALASDSDITISDEPGIRPCLELDAGLNLAAVLGYGFGDMRLEGEIGWQKNDADKVTLAGDEAKVGGDISILSFLLNGYYDFNNSTAFTPFVSGGIGFAKLDADLQSAAAEVYISEDDTVFAYQIGIGIAYAVSETVAIDAKYRFFGTADPEFGTVEAEVQSHNFMLGIRVGF